MFTLPPGVVLQELDGTELPMRLIHEAKIELLVLDQHGAPRSCDGLRDVSAAQCKVQAEGRTLHKLEQRRLEHSTVRAEGHDFSEGLLTWHAASTVHTCRSPAAQGSAASSMTPRQQHQRSVTAGPM